MSIRRKIEELTEEILDTRESAPITDIQEKLVSLMMIIRDSDLPDDVKHQCLYVLNGAHDASDRARIAERTNFVRRIVANGTTFGPTDDR